jgi:hypothetical protein
MIPFSGWDVEICSIPGQRNRSGEIPSGGVSKKESRKELFRKKINPFNYDPVPNR